jgi:epoxyqueuosine reductase QueG
VEHPVLVAIQHASFMPLAWFPARPNDELPNEAKFTILIGNAGPAMFRRFQLERRHGPQPLDEWCRTAVNRLASTLDAHAVFPFDKPYLPFLTWARRGGAGHISPLGLNIHPVYGLWHAYRAALLFPVELDLPVPKPGLHPCDVCEAKPCLNACPVSAFGSAGYDAARCVDHLSRPEGEACMSMGCMARRACPIGSGFAYQPAQAQFHMQAFRATQLAKASSRDDGRKGTTGSNYPEPV